MNLIIFGASGSTGRLLVDQALAAGHCVTAFVRDPARLSTKHPQLRVAVGDVMKAESVEARQRKAGSFGQGKSNRLDHRSPGKTLC